jgi:hypothetical protein
LVFGSMAGNFGGRKHNRSGEGARKEKAEERVWQRFATNWAIVCCRSTWKGVQYELNNHVDKLRDR